ncbi:MAG: Hpt domain-containing protein [Chitinivibrionales bacterium]
MNRLEREIKEALINMGNDKEIFSEVLHAFIQDFPVKIQGMRRGISEKDTRSLKENAHTLKSSARICGLLQLGEIAERVEEEERVTPDTDKDIQEMERLLKESETILRDKGFI